MPIWRAKKKPFRIGKCLASPSTASNAVMRPRSCGCSRAVVDMADARGGAIRPERDQRPLGGGARRPRVATARMEAATLGQGARARDRTGNCREPVDGVVELGDRAEQALGIGMLGCRE